MSNELLLFIGGFFHLGFVVFHLLFYRIFNWKEELQRISFLNRQVVFLLNICLSFLFLSFAALSWGFSREMIESDLGQILTLLIAAFWLFRLLLQFYCFGIRNVPSNVFAGILLIGVLIYGVVGWS